MKAEAWVSCLSIAYLLSILSILEVATDTNGLYQGGSPSFSMVLSCFGASDISVCFSLLEQESLEDILPMVFDISRLETL